MDTPKQALLAAITVADTQTCLAERLTEFLQSHPDPTLKNKVITQGHVAMWVVRGRAASNMCKAIEAITGVEARALRPDVFYEGAAE